MIEYSSTLPSFKPTVELQLRIPYHIHEKVQNAIDKLVQDDIIEEVPQTKATPWVRTIPEDGSVRICVDMQKANQVIRRVRNLLPTVDEISQE